MATETKSKKKMFKTTTKKEGKTNLKLVHRENIK